MCVPCGVSNSVGGGGILICCGVAASVAVFVFNGDSVNIQLFIISQNISVILFVEVKIHECASLCQLEGTKTTQLQYQLKDVEE